MRAKKKIMALLLAFSMVMSLFTGQVVVGTEAEAAGDDTIVLGELQKAASGIYYTYPNAAVQIQDSSKTFHNLTVTVDSGHMMVDTTAIAGVTGQGVVSGDDMNVSFGDITTSGKYESISFEFGAGVVKSDIEQFIRQIKFTTSTKLQTVTMCAATDSVQELKTDVNGQNIDLKYFNGHYYGFVPNKTWKKTMWSEAYKEAKSAQFHGVNGYLLTLTSRAEDRFILSSFPQNAGSDYAKMGWMGCTRAVLSDGSSYNDADTLWKPLAVFDGTNFTDFIWRWVSGPEAGEAFGYQSDAYGYGNTDGGFVANDGCFSNWNAQGNIEPNGGKATEEAFGFYGKYLYGRWNDNEGDNPLDNIEGYYIEFGGHEGDDTIFEEELDQIIVTTEETTSEIITDGSYTEETEPEKTPIGGTVVIKNNDKDDDGNEIKKEGTVLTADITGVTPEGSHDTLTYQWYIKDGEIETPIVGAVDKNYVLTTDTLDKKLVVKVTGNGDYYGDVKSEPYDTTRTNAGIDVENPDGENDKKTIIIQPTLPDTIYAIKDEQGNVLTNIPTYDENGNLRTPDVTDTDYPGYYTGTEDGMLKFTELDPDKTYIISEIKIDKKNSEIVGPSIPDTDIDTEYDDKNTEDAKDDTISIIIDPALPDCEYAVLKKEDGVYKEVTVKKDENGNYVADSTGSAVWTDGGEDIVRFTDLPADGVYKVVAKSSTSTDDKVTNADPSDVTGGSNDIDGSQVQKPGDSSNGNNNNQNNNNQNNNQNNSNQNNNPSSGNSSNITFTKQEEDAAAKFVKEHATDPKGKIVTDITDMTRDIIVSGENDWKKLTPNEKAAVNARLKAGGSKYTYEQLLKMAKSYKIPGFKVIKFMKKKSKAKLKLIKCKGATIVCTSTNKKVATVNKKGVISAKKPGRARLTFTAIKGKYTNRLVIDVRVKKKFKNARELTKFKSKVIKTPTVLIAKKRLLKKSSKIQVYDLLKSSKVKFTPIKKNILTINKKGKYTGKKKGSTLVRVKINQNKKVYLLYVYVTIY